MNARGRAAVWNPQRARCESGLLPHRPAAEKRLTPLTLLASRSGQEQLPTITSIGAHGTSPRDLPAGEPVDFVSSATRPDFGNEFDTARMSLIEFM